MQTRTTTQAGQAGPEAQSALAEVEGRVKALHRRLALRAAAWSATAWFAALGWLVLAALALPRLVAPSTVQEWPWLAEPVLPWAAALFVLAVLGLAAVRAALRVRRSEAARHLDHELAAGRFTLYTAWEDTPRHSALRAALHRHLARIIASEGESVRHVALPAWRHPVLALLALCWLALCGWFVVALPVPEVQPEWGGDAELAARVQAVGERAAARGDEALADSATEVHRAMQAAAMHAEEDGLAAALARAERMAAHRREELERQAMFLEALEEAQQALAEGELGEADWERMRAELKEKSAATGREEAEAQLSQLSREEAAEVLAQLALQEREERDEQAALDARWKAILEELAAQRPKERETDERVAQQGETEHDDRSRRTTEPSSKRRNEAHDLDAESDTESDTNAGSGHLRPAESSPAEEERAPRGTSEPHYLELGEVRPGERSQLDPADAATLPAQLRPLAHRLVRWQQSNVPANGDEVEPAE